MLDAKGLQFEGEVLGPSLESGLGTLFDAMTAQRKQWKSLSPDKPFPGVVDIHLPPKVSCSAALRLLSTAADAGFPNVKLWRDGTSHDIAVSPGTHFPLPELMAKLQFRADGKVELRKDSCGPAYDAVVPKDVLAPLKKLLPNDKLVSAQIGCEESVAFDDVFGMFETSGLRRDPGAQINLAMYQPCRESRNALEPLAQKDQGGATLKLEVVERHASVPDAVLLAAAEKLSERFKGCWAGGRRLEATISPSAVVRLELSDRGNVVSSSAQLYDGPFQADACLSAAAREIRVEPAPSEFVEIQLRLEFGAGQRGR